MAIFFFAFAVQVSTAPAVSFKMQFCPHCKTPLSVIQSQNPKKKRTTPILVPVLSVLDGLVLLGTVGLLTWGVMNPTVISPPTMESAVTSTDPGTACDIISTLQRNAAKNYNRYYSGNIIQEEPAELIAEPTENTDVAQTETVAEAVEPTADQAPLPVDETAEVPAQSATPQQAAKEERQQQPAETPIQATSSPAPTVDTSTPSTNNNERDFSGGRVLATTASNNNNDPVYHTRNCASAQRIAKEDELWYDSADAAIADGRRKCKRC